MLIPTVLVFVNLLTDVLQKSYRDDFVRTKQRGSTAQSPELLDCAARTGSGSGVDTVVFRCQHCSVQWRRCKGESHGDVYGVPLRRRVVDGLQQRSPNAAVLERRRHKDLAQPQPRTVRKRVELKCRRHADLRDTSRAL